MKGLISLYSLRLPIYLVYMLQQVEYQPQKFSEWLLRLIKENRRISGVMERKSLVMTNRAKLLIVSAYLFAVIVTFFYVLLVQTSFGWPIAVLAIFIALPVVTVSFLWVASYVARKCIVEPQLRRATAEATVIFAAHKAVKIAVLGSYGKTSLKEMLSKVLGQKLTVAATPGNMNVISSQARFARSLHGNEEVLIVEFGEGEPGDIKRMSKMLQPDYAIITGLAPNHLEMYDTLPAVAEDFADIFEVVESEKVFTNADDDTLQKYTKDKGQTYSSGLVMGWKINSAKVSVDSLSFKMTKGKGSLQIQSSLVGRHQIAPLALSAALADRLGLSKDQIEKGVAKTKPFEHRMQPRLVQGAWLIDDTYNGNIEGMKAGLRLLAELPSKRKWYVTPGLVDQGVETERVHVELGTAIAKTQPDIVVLMENSVRSTIEASLQKNDYKGELRKEKNPLEFYSSIEHLVAAGDVVLMQNDWTDNYS